MDDHSGCCCQVPIPSGHYRGLLLVDVLTLEDGGAIDWLAWAARRPFGYWPRWFQEALREFIDSHDLTPQRAEDRSWEASDG